MDITTTSFAAHEFLYVFIVTASLVAILMAALFAMMFMLERRYAVAITLFLVVCGGAFLFEVFASAPSDRVSEARADIEGRAEFEHGITELSPLNGSINTCVEDSDHDAAAYAWTTEEGDKVTGHITKTAEADGKCVYTFIVLGADT